MRTAGACQNRSAAHHTDKAASAVRRTAAMASVMAPHIQSSVSAKLRSQAYAARMLGATAFGLPAEIVSGHGRSRAGGAGAGRFHLLRISIAHHEEAADVRVAGRRADGTSEALGLDRHLVPSGRRHRDQPE